MEKVYLLIDPESETDPIAILSCKKKIRPAIRHYAKSQHLLLKRIEIKETKEIEVQVFTDDEDDFWYIDLRYQEEELDKFEREEL